MEKRIAFPWHYYEAQERDTGCSDREEIKGRDKEEI